MARINSPQFQELSDYFTSDGWRMIISFVENLKKRLDQFDIDIEEKESIFNGIEEFIQEFVEEYKDKAKITFNEALSLIREIGSPSEIIQSMDLTIEQMMKQVSVKDPIESDKIICKACSWPNEPDSRFCDSCGKKLIELEEEKDVVYLPQIMFRFPNVTSIIFTYFIFFFYGLFIGIIAIAISPEWESQNITELFLSLFVLLIAPAIIYGLIFGYLIETLDKELEFIVLPQEVINHPSIFSVIFSYLLILIISIIVEFIIFISNRSYTPLWLVTTFLQAGALLSPPAVVLGLFLGYLIQKLGRNQESPNVQKLRKLDWIP
ncbi:MAG: hypothetical protein ACFFB5_07035 [Promethearchaeota archaeon]